MTRNRERRLGIGLLLGTACLVVGAIAYARANMGDDIARDARHCPMDVARTKRWSAVLVDWTDRFTPSQSDELKAIVDRLAERMDQDEGLSLHLITSKAEDAGEPWRGFAYCKPRDPKAVNPITETASFIRRDYEKTFGRPLAAALGGLLKGGEAPRSPILEAIDAAMWTPRFRAAPERRIVIYSDLLQHTEELSHLKGRLPDPCRVTESEAGKRLVGRLQGVSVELHYAINAKHRGRQGAAHLNWWSETLYRLGAAAVFDGERLIAKAGGDCMRPAPRKQPARQRAR